MFDFLYSINILGLSTAWQAIKDALAWFLNALYMFTDAINIPSYALAIVLFTIIIKFALYPLSLKQMRSMRGMQKIQPLIAEINTKYADNPQKKNEETFRVYKDYNINPMSGCLPLLIQFPILIALYRTIYNFVPIAGSNYSFFWIDNISQTDPTGWILAVCVGAATFLQQKMATVDTSNPSQRMMLYIMPIFFAFLSRSFPAALSIYWISFSILGGVQQIIVNKQCDRLEARAEAQRLEEAKTDPKKRQRKYSELERAIEAQKAAKEKALQDKQKAKERKASGEKVKTKLTADEIFSGDHPWSPKPEVAPVTETVDVSEDVAGETVIETDAADISQTAILPVGDTPISRPVVVDDEVSHPYSRSGNDDDISRPVEGKSNNKTPVRKKDISQPLSEEMKGKAKKSAKKHKLSKKKY